MVALQVSSDAEAWDLLRSLLNSDPDSDEFELEKLNLDGWPSLDVSSQKGIAEIDALTMRGLVSVQEGVWRTFTTLDRGTRSLRSIRQEEKKELLLSVKVSEGSSKYNIDLQKALLKIGKKLAGKLTARDIIIIVLGLGLVFAGQSVWKSHISENAKTRIAKIHSQDMQATLETFSSLSKAETERMKVLADAFAQVPETRAGEAEASSARQELLKNLPSGYGVEIEGIDLPSPVLDEIVKSDRTYSQDVTVKRVYFIEKAQTNQDGFQVRLRDAETEQTLSAHFGDALTSQNERALVREAFFGKTAILLTLDAKQRGDLIVSATIKHAQRID